MANGVYVYQQIVKTTAEWAEDTSVWPKNVWLFEQKADGKIGVKLSDGLSTFGRLPEKILDAYEAAQLGGYEGTRAGFYRDLKNVGVSVASIKALIDAIREDGAAGAPTLSGVPDEDTLSYESDGLDIPFAVGNECRVWDSEQGKWVFYKLYDITQQGKADWQLSTGADVSVFQEAVTISLTSNQGASDAALSGAVVEVSYGTVENEYAWNGSPFTVNVPMNTEYTIHVPAVTGYAAPSDLTFTAAGGNKRNVVLSYSCELLTVNVAANDDADVSGRTVTVKDTETDTVIGSGSGSTVNVKIPTGTPYAVSVDAWNGYVTPAIQTATANSAIRSMTFEYEKIVDAGIVFDKSVSDPSNITGDVNSGVIAMILARFRRCLCKKTADGEVTIAYLRNDNSNYYEDGTAAVLDGTQGDVMVDFPEFYYKWEQVDSNKFRYRFALYDVDGTFKHVPRSLVGAYKAYMTGNKLYSRSGVAPTVSTSSNDFDSYATARGTGYQRIDFQQHCVIAFMLYAKYGNRNLQAVLGKGGASYSPLTNTGTTNAIGNADTVNVTTGYVNGLGLEGVFGGIYEWVKGVSINNRVWTITDPDGTQRTVNAHTADGWITNIAAENGPFFDMVPTGVGGSETTHYSDYYWQSSGSSLVLARSCDDSNADGGVAYADASLDASGTYSIIGSRLAFRGVVREAQSVSAFKSLPVL